MFPSTDAHTMLVLHHDRAAVLRAEASADRLARHARHAGRHRAGWRRWGAQRRVPGQLPGSP